MVEVSGKWRTGSGWRLMGKIVEWVRVANLGYGIVFFYLLFLIVSPTINILRPALLS